MHDLIHSIARNGTKISANNIKFDRNFLKVITWSNKVLGYVIWMNDFNWFYWKSPKNEELKQLKIFSPIHNEKFPFLHSCVKCLGFCHFLPFCWFKNFSFSHRKSCNFGTLQLSLKYSNSWKSQVITTSNWKKTNNSKIYLVYVW